MEISVIASSQVNLGTSYDAGLFSFGKNSSAKIGILKKKNPKACCLVHHQSLKLPQKSTTTFTLRASAAHQSADNVNSEKASTISRNKTVDGIRLLVGLPLDTVSNSNKINRARAIAAGLKALKVLGVTGIELPVWWGIAEKEAMGKYEWTSYLAVVEMVQKLGLELHVSLCFHASEECRIGLPEWVSQIGEGDPGIFFTDRLGQQCKDCLSFAVDDVAVLDGKTPVEVYRDFCEDFKVTFSPFLGSTITSVSIGLGPDGELRYPHHHRPSKSKGGAGEFLCYDKYMLSNLKQHAEIKGSPLWGLSGPHDALGDDSSLLTGGFFAESGGSWETPYGDFFLSWYSSLLLSHGDRMLSVATSTFRDTGIAVSGRVPLIHSWHHACSRPAELTAGFYNTAGREGYKDVVRIFSENSCGMILPGMDIPDPSSQSVLDEITASCIENGVKVSSQNSLPSGGGFDQMKKKLLETNSLVDTFTYQRMGGSFFLPEHFSHFVQFVRSVTRPVRRIGDVVVRDGRDDEFFLGSRSLQPA